MSKILAWEAITLDGFFAGPEGEISWHQVDDEFHQLAIEVLTSVGTLVFGHVTYELMVGYWPTDTAATDNPVMAEKINTLPKIVFSKTLSSAAWGKRADRQAGERGPQGRNCHLETEVRQGPGGAGKQPDHLGAHTSWLA